MGKTIVTILVMLLAAALATEIGMSIQRDNARNEAKQAMEEVKRLEKVVKEQAERHAQELVATREAIKPTIVSRDNCWWNAKEIIATFDSWRTPTNGTRPAYAINNYPPVTYSAPVYQVVPAPVVCPAIPTQITTTVFHRRTLFTGRSSAVIRGQHLRPR